jgi:hypothetical protein
MQPSTKGMATHIKYKNRIPSPGRRVYTIPPTKHEVLKDGYTRLDAHPGWLGRVSSNLSPSLDGHERRLGVR